MDRGYSVFSVTWILVMLLISSVAYGSSSRDLIISKLESVWVTQPAQSEAWLKISLRLADLLAERARDTALRENTEGCPGCVPSEEDRAKAMKFYQAAFPRLKDDLKINVLFQMAHMHELNGDTKKAISGYQELLKGSLSQEIKAKAHAELGEIYFKQRWFQKAISHFDSAIEGGVKRLGLAYYRKAWCHYSLGNGTLAISLMKKVLSSPKLLTRNADTSHAVSVDVEFQTEVSRDLATFLAKTSPGMDEVKTLYSLTPGEAKIEHLYYLSGELERLGDSVKALNVWEFILSKETRPEFRHQVQLKLAAVARDQKKWEHSVKRFNESLMTWNGIGCTPDSCKKLYSETKDFLVDTYQENRKKSSDKIIPFSEEYLAVFSDDIEVMYWTAGLKDQNKDYVGAIQLYRKLIRALKKGVPPLAAKMKPEKIEKLKEDSVLKQIELAEKAGDVNLKRAAYQFYLDSSEKKEKNVEVHYQLAKLRYDEKDNLKASQELKSVALLNSTRASEKKLRKMAAHLSLDALAILKADEKIAAWAKEYAKLFPSERKEFLDVARKSSQNLSVTAAKTNPQKAWDILQTISLDGLETGEKLKLMKNRFVLAEKLQKYKEARDLLSRIERTPNHQKEFQADFLLTRRAWISEVFFDFKKAYQATRKMSKKAISDSERSFKLVLLGDLAGLNTEKEYIAYLKASREKQTESKLKYFAKKAYDKSSNTKKTLAQLRPILKDHPETYAELEFLELSQTGNMVRVRKLLKDEKFKATAPGQWMDKLVWVENFEKQAARVAKHKISSKTTSRLKRSLRKRTKLIEGLEKTGEVALNREDWMMQVVLVDVLAKEYDRLKSDILALPIPKGLTDDEANQYRVALATQVAPYQQKAEELKMKLGEFWANQLVIQKLYDNLKDQDERIARFLLGVYQKMAPYAPELHRVAWNTKVDTELKALDQAQKAQVTTAQVLDAQVQVRQDPFNLKSLRDLKALEEQTGRTEMAAYIGERIRKIENKERI